MKHHQTGFKHQPLDGAGIRYLEILVKGLLWTIWTTRNYRAEAHRHIEDNLALLLGYAGNDWNHQESKSVEIGVKFLDIQILTS